jgi:hypothetical protein
VTARYRADLFGISLDAPSGAPSEAPAAAAQAANPGARLGPETLVPNPGLRMGLQRARITGAGLYDPRTQAAANEARAGDEILLRVTVTNDTLPAGARMIFGYMLTTPRGEEIGGLNTRMVEFAFAAPESGAGTTIAARIRLPDLHPAHYALTIAIASESDAGRVEIEDRVEKAMVFQVLNEREVVGWMRLATSFALE